MSGIYSSTTDSSDTTAMLDVSIPGGQGEDAET